MVESVTVRANVITDKTNITLSEGFTLEDFLDESMKLIDIKEDRVIFIIPNKCGKCILAEDYEVVELENSIAVQSEKDGVILEFPTEEIKGELVELEDNK